jgi:hypothetical protein
MLRGTLIFTSGLLVGYAFAMKNQEPNGEVKAAASEFLRTMKSVMADSWLDAKNEAKAAKEAKPCPHCGEPRIDSS